MDGHRGSLRPASIHRAIGATGAMGVALAAIFWLVLATPAAAQVLTDPHAPGAWSPPPGHPKSKPASHANSCGAYGAGFANVPGTDLCVKVGGSVGVEGTARGR